MKWTDDALTVLKQMWEEGQTSSDIAYRLNTTRNSVLGKVHRLKLPIHKSARRPKSAPGERKKPMTVIVRKVPLRPIIVEPSLDQDTWVPFMESRATTCRAIMGRGSDGLVLFCPNGKLPEDSYCPYHSGIYYNKSSR